MKSEQEIKVGIYARLSRDDERSGESLSIENQKLILEKYVLEKGWNLIGTYIDDGYSGTTFDRPGVQKLLEDAKYGKINTIVVKDLSRFGRNYIQVGQYTDYIFPMYNIRFIALNDNVDTSKNTTGMDMMPIMNVFNEWHSANTSKKIRAVVEANAKAGKYRSGYAPYGYLIGENEKRLPVVNPETAPIVKEIFEMRAKGISAKHISEHLNEKNIKTPLDYKKDKLGVKTTRQSIHFWCCDMVKQILRNPIYLGHIYQMQSTTISYKNHKKIKRPESEWVVNYNTHEAIISQQLWDKCREIDNSVSQGKKTKTGIVMPLSGLCYCEDCGNKMYVCQNNTRHSRKGPRIYFRQNYNCGNYEKFGNRVCTSHYIKMKDINNIVLQDIKSKAKLVLEDEKQARDEFLSRQNKQISQSNSNDLKRQTTISKRITELTKLIQSSYEDKVLNKIPEEICISLLNNYQKEKEELQNELNEINNRLQEDRTNTKNVDEFIKRVKKYIEAPELTREMCLELIEFITVDEFPHEDKHKPRKIHIYYKLIDNTSGEEFNKSRKLCL